MLTRQQWLWLADHHKEVRSWSRLTLALAMIVYVGLMAKTSFDKGKAPISYRPAISYWEKLGCGPAITILPIAPPKPQWLYEDASIFLLERHYTWPMIINSDFYRTKPECLWARLTDDADNPNPFVYLVYEKAKDRVVYRIARLDDALKR